MEEKKLTKIPKWLEGTWRGKVFDKRSNQFFISQSRGVIFINLRSHQQSCMLDYMTLDVPGDAVGAVKETLSEDDQIYTIEYDTAEQSGLTVSFNSLNERFMNMQVSVAGTWVSIVLLFHRVS